MKVNEKIVQNFVLATLDLTVIQVITRLDQRALINYVIVMLEDEPIALATRDQLQALPRQGATLGEALNNLPKVIIVEQSQTMDQVVKDFSALLLGSPAISGIVAINQGIISGVLPRRAIAEYASSKMHGAMRGGELEGDPLSSARRYECPLGDYETDVPFYDRFNPPVCPNHKVLLIRKI